jgi:hypothetical protein
MIVSFYFCASATLDTMDDIRAIRRAMESGNVTVKELTVQKIHFEQ